jgi:HK97 family phage major capsid protein
MTEAQAQLADEQAADAAEARFSKPADPEARGQEQRTEEKVSLGRYLQAVASMGGMDSERSGYFMAKAEARALLAETRAPSGMSEAAPSDGGFLVGTQQAGMLAQRAYGEGKIAALCERIPISGPFNGLKYPVIDETSRADGSRSGGVLAYWKNEAAAGTHKAPKIGEQNLNLEKLIGLCYVTDELLQDATALEVLISAEFGKEFSFKLDDAVINGLGAGVPLGILNAGCLVSVAKETGQTAKTLNFENVVNMYSRHWSGSAMATTRWVMNRQLIPQVMALAIKVGTAGFPLYIPGNSLAGTPNGTLLGVPIIFAEQSATPGTVGDIGLFDFGQYRIIDKAGIQAASSMHVLFTTDEMAFRFVMRVNGQPLWKSALTPYKDASTSQTVSPFVTVAARA